MEFLRDWKTLKKLLNLLIKQLLEIYMIDYYTFFFISKVYVINKVDIYLIYLEYGCYGLPNNYYKNVLKIVLHDY